MFITIKITILNLLPLLITSIGACFSGNVGISNLGLEGSIIIGAFSSAIFSYYFSNAWAGLSLALLIVLILAFLQAFILIKIKAETVMAGTAYNLLMSGFSIFVLKSIFKVSGNSPSAPLLPTIFKFPILSYFILILVFISYFLINKIFNRLIYKNKHLTFIKYLSFILSNVFAALAGIYLSLGRVGYFNPNLSGGRGFIALAIASLADNNTIKVLAIITLFGLIDIAQYFKDLYHLNIPTVLLSSLPYALTLALLSFKKYFKNKKISNYKN